MKATIVMVWLTTLPEDEAVVELEAAPDRGAAIIAGALLDSRLGELLSNELNGRDTQYAKQIRKAVFGSDGPLGSFGMKNNFAYLMGVFTADAHSDLRNIIKVRNEFAHGAKSVSFESEGIRERCAQFRLISRVHGPNAFRQNKDGTRIYSDSWGLKTPNPEDRAAGKVQEVHLGLVDYELVLSTNRGKFLAMAKLFLAAFWMYRDKGSTLEKPIL